MYSLRQFSHLTLISCLREFEWKLVSLIDRTSFHDLIQATLLCYYDAM